MMHNKNQAEGAQMPSNEEIRCLLILAADWHEADD